MHWFDLLSRLVFCLGDIERSGCHCDRNEQRAFSEFLSWANSIHITLNMRLISYSLHVQTLVLEVLPASEPEGNVPSVHFWFASVDPQESLRLEVEWVMKNFRVMRHLPETGVSRFKSNVHS